MAINLAGFLYSDNGTAIQSASITLIDSGGNTEATTTTNSSGYWSFAEADEDVYDIKIQSGSQIRYVKGLDKITLSEIDVRNSAANSTGAFTFTNSTNNASNKVGTFRSLNTTRADGDEIYLSFNLMNDNAEETEFARITAEANDVSNGSEDGEIRFSVMKAGTLTEVWNLNSSTAGATSMDMNVDSFTIGTGTAATDITLTFDAETNDGVITWMEDEEYFAFSDEILMNSTEKLLFGDTGTFIHQSSDGVLTITSDTTVDINGAVVFDGALSGITTLGASGVITAGGLTIGSAVIVESELEMIDGITAGTAAANKAVVLDGSKNIATIGTIGSAAITSTGTSSFGSGTTIGNLTLANGSITDSGGALDFGNETLTTTGAVDFGAATVDSLSVSDANITNVADIALDSISADGTDINIAVSDNSATALTIKQGSDAYLIVDTANSSESVSIGTGISGTAITLGHSTSEVTVADNLTVTGDLTVSGTTTTVNSTTVTVDDPIFTLGGDSDPGSDDNKDRGIEFRYHDGSSALRGFFGFDDSSGKFTALTSATNSSEVFSGTAMPAIFGNIEGAAISGTTGTFSGVMDITDTTDASDATGDTGALRTEGGASIAKKLYVGTDLDVDGDADIDGTLEADAYTVDGTALNEYIADTVGAMTTSNTETGSTVTYQDADNTIDFVVGTLNQDTTGTAAVATTVTITDNESTNEDNAIIFAAGGDVDGGNLGLESDGTLTYNPSTGTVTATAFAGNLTGNVTGNVTGNTSGTAATVTGAAQSNITSLGTLTTLTVDNVITNGTTIGHTDDTDLMTLADGVLSVAGNLDVSGSLEVATIDYTDGDLAVTIADGGGVTFAQDISTTDAKYIKLGGSRMATSEPASNTSGYGIVIGFDSAGSVSQGDAVYINSSGKVAQARADEANVTDPAIGIATNDAASDGDDCYVLTHGIWRMDAEAFDAGDPVYLGESAGAITKTAPSDDGDYVQRIGIAVSDDVLLVMPSIDVIEHA